MAHIDDEKPQAEDEAQDASEAPEVIAHGIEDDTTLGEMDCKIFIEL